ncbi:hypothetical protein DERP_002861 [Dermatophagoides pteronyssinus]|uniref:Secreted protein n=1 Tax=Dermatophagoides pteronyssinus TaxID=6956 RepID=A0ABQ8JWU3_DERPT|nr:hypothetical protein DERP_002861 [Dermatophagoides pteronyssinus]
MSPNYFLVNSPFFLLIGCCQCCLALWTQSNKSNLSSPGQSNLFTLISLVNHCYLLPVVVADPPIFKSNDRV